jgi:hypothetical protein
LNKLFPIIFILTFFDWNILIKLWLNNTFDAYLSWMWRLWGRKMLMTQTFVLEYVCQILSRASKTSGSFLSNTARQTTSFGAFGALMTTSEHPDVLPLHCWRNGAHDVPLRLWTDRFKAWHHLGMALNHSCNKIFYQCLENSIKWHQNITIMGSFVNYVTILAQLVSVA